MPVIVVVVAVVVIVVGRLSCSSPNVDASPGRRIISESVFPLECRGSRKSVPVRRQWDIAVGELLALLVVKVDLARGLLMAGRFSGMVVVVAQIPLDMVPEAGLVQLTVVLGTEGKGVDLAAFDEVLCVGADQATECAVLGFDDAAVTCSVTCFPLGRLDVMVSSEVIWG